MKMNMFLHKPDSRGIVTITTMYESRGKDFWHTWDSAFKLIKAALALAIFGRAGTTAAFHCDQLHFVEDVETFMEKQQDKLQGD